MLRKLLKFLLFSFLSFVAVIFFLLVLLAFTMGPRVRDNSLLVLNLEGPLPERGPQDWKERLLVGDMLTTRGVLNALEKAKTDDRIKALVVSSLFSQLGPARAQEIRAAIKDFARSSRKPVHGFIEDGGTLDYYLASAAPKVYMPPDGDSWFTLLGIRAEVPFIKGTLDKLGIVPQMDHIGKYKSGSELYTRQNMSDANREQTRALLDSLFNRLSADIATERKLDTAQLQKMINYGPFISSEMKERRLIDDLLYWDELRDKIKKEVRVAELHEISALEYQKPTFSEAFNQKAEKLAIIYGIGSIMPGESSEGFGEDMMGSTTISAAFQKAREDKSVKAIVFRVDSPGGSPSASDIIWREVKVTARKKPVVVSMGDVAASGGYYISMAATKIFADPSTITGSIGVYGGKFYMKGLYDKLGITKEILKRGEHADMFSDYRPFSDEEWQIVRRHMSHTYDAFTRKAGEGRKRTQQQIHAVGQGRVWSGDQAIRLGLVDQLGGLKDAIAEAKKLAKAKDLSVITYPSSGGGFDDMFVKAHVKSRIQKELTELILWAKIAEREHQLLVMPYKFFVN